MVLLLLCIIVEEPFASASHLAAGGSGWHVGVIVGSVPERPRGRCVAATLLLPVVHLIRVLRWSRRRGIIDKGAASVARMCAERAAAVRRR